jgi:hypothetical protein
LESFWPDPSGQTVLLRLLKCTVEVWDAGMVPVDIQTYVTLGRDQKSLQKIIDLPVIGVNRFQPVVKRMNKDFSVR